MNPSTTAPEARDAGPGSPAPAPAPAPVPAPTSDAATASDPTPAWDPAEAELTERIGFEIELLAPAGSSREVLARELARRHGGSVRRFFHTDSEPSLVPGITSFLHLTLGFAVVDAEGAPLCRLVDDITIRQDLDPRVPALPGWYRIVSDEPRLLRLVERHADPDAPLARVLDPVAELFGVVPQTHERMVKVEDTEGSPIALAAPLPGERHRPCEVITPPIAGDHRRRLDQLLSVARELGFTVPAEAAVHLHLDAAPLRQVTTLTNLVRLFSAWREPLREALATNARCRRLAPLPDALVELVADPPSAQWSEVARAAAGTGITKYADVNLTRMVTGPRAEKDTVEIRCLPGVIDTDAVLTQAALVERLLRRCRDPRPLPEPRPGDPVERLLDG